MEGIYFGRNITDEYWLNWWTIKLNVVSDGMFKRNSHGKKFPWKRILKRLWYYKLNLSDKLLSNSRLKKFVARLYLVLHLHETSFCRQKQSSINFFMQQLFCYKIFWKPNYHCHTCKLKSDWTLAIPERIEHFW